MSGLAAPDNKISVDVKDGMNDDIIDVLHKRFPAAVTEAGPVSHKFKGRDRLDTARKLWQWLRTDIKYAKDPDGVQDIRMPRYFHHHKAGDCKSFTLNSLAIWHNLYPNDKIRFFYAGYGDGTKTPTHVYGKIQPADGGREIIIDGCWYFVNSEKKYSFGKYSPNMQVRTLSGFESVQVNGIDVAGMYDAMSPYERGRVEHCISDLVQLKLLELAKKNEVKSPDEILKHLEGIEQGIAKRHKRGGGGKKFLHYINAAALFLGRSAFLLFVTLNVNGLASKLGQLVKWGKATGIMDMWYIMGGNIKKFKKIIARSQKRKKLFLSKKARLKYEARYGPLSPGEVAYEKGVHGEIGIAPAIAAAAIAVVPVLAGIIPKMIDAFRKAGAPGHQEAAGLINEGKDLAHAVETQGYPINSDTVNAFLPNGQTTDTGARPGNGAAFTPKTGAAPVSFKFDWRNLNPIGDINFIGDTTDTPEQQAYDAQHYPAPADTPAPSATYTPTPGTPPDQFADTMKTLGPILQTVTTAGLQTAASVLSQSRNPNIQHWGNALGGAESVLTGHVLRQGGYTQEANMHDQIHKGTVVNLFPIVLGAGALFAVYEFTKSKPVAAA